MNDNYIATKFKAIIRILFVFGRITVSVIHIRPISKDPLFSTALPITKHYRHDVILFHKKHTLVEVSDYSCGERVTEQMMKHEATEMNQAYPMICKRGHPRTGQHHHDEPTQVVMEFDHTLEPTLTL